MIRALRLGLTPAIRRGGRPIDADVALDAFETCLIALEGAHAWLIAGADSLASFAAALGASRVDAEGLVAALTDLTPEAASAIATLRDKGAPFALEAAGGQRIALEGAAAGVLTLLKISRQGAESGPGAEVFAAFVDARAEPC